MSNIQEENMQARPWLALASVNLAYLVFRLLLTLALKRVAGLP